MIPSFKKYEDYRNAIVWHCADTGEYFVSRLSADKKEYLLRSKEYKTLKSCKNFVDKFYKENNIND